MTAMAPMQLLLLLLWVDVTISKVVDLHKRIYNGKECEPSERHYHVKLIVSYGKTAKLCGGSLIHQDWVLTAAHCWEDPWTMVAVLGSHQGQGKKVQVKDQIIFQTKILKFIKMKKDIMLVKLEKPSQIAPVALPDNVQCANPPELGQAVQVAGYGRYQVDTTGKTLPNKPNKLQCADMDVVSCECPIDSFCFFWPQTSRMCLQKPDVDICKGDSGGGVIYKDRIYGVIVGSGTDVCTASAVALKVCSYIEWIRETITKP